MREAGVPGRVYFRLRTGIPFNIALVAVDGVHWRNNLALRDFLLKHPEQAEEYARAKQTAVQSGANSLLAYSECKSGTVVHLIQRAISWAGEGETPKGTTH